LSNQEKDKTRVYEYAKSLNMSSKEIITILKRLGKPVNNHMSVMEKDAVDSVEKFFRDVKANAAAKHAAQEASQQQAARQQVAQAQAASQAAAPAPTRPTESPAPAANRTATGTQSHTPRPAAASQGGSNTQGSNRPSGGQSASQSTGSGQANRSQSSNYQGQRNDQRPARPSGGTSSNQQRPQGQGQSQGQGNRPNHSNPNRTNSSSAGQRPAQSQGAAGDRGSYQRPQSSSAQASPASANRSSQPTSTGPRGAAPTTAAGATAPDRTRNFGENKPKGGTKPFQGRSDDFNKGKKGTGKPGDKRFDDARSGGRYKGKGKYKSQEKKEKIDNTPKKIIVRGEMTVGELAKILHKDASEVIKKLLFLGVMATINQELDLDTIQLIADDYKIEVEVKIAVDEDNFELVEETDELADLEERPPVVTIMGHVDHGKTTLLDAIRSTNVIADEFGGITQHIGAYQVEINNKKISFLDTPGHEAFTSMRARGAQVTDITIIVVAADDGVMPQTIEAINHAKAADVPIIVAVNKIDKEGANPDRVKQELTEHGLVPEEWGGDTIFANISAKQRIGLEELLEMILLVAEVRELKANANKRARGTVLEAELDKGKGAVARVLIQNGTLRVGDAFVAGVCFGRVRTMINDKGRRLKEAPPSTPVEITGMTDVPLAGDPFIVFEDERKARSIAERRATTVRQSSFGANTRVTLDDLFQHIKDGEMKELNVIIKGDVQGTVEALRSSLEKIDVEGVRVKIIHIAVGAINESDINLASASNAIVIGFNVRPEAAAKSMSEQEKVDVRLYTIIYKAIEEIEAAMKGLLDPIFKESVIGHAEVRNIFKVTKIGTIAGCMVTDGKITRNAQVRLLRAGVLVFEGKIDSLKRFKDDAKEVAQGYECGISLEKYNDIRDGDIIEAYVMESVER
jgi:translation initiation factor IF-2